MNRYFTIRAMVLFVFAMFLLSASVAAQIGIEFNFANSQVTNDGSNSYYEFDITATATASSQFYIAQVYIDYNTVAFGSSIYANSNIVLTKGPLLASLFGPNGDGGSYTLQLADNTSSRVTISNIWAKFDTGGGDEGYELSNTLGTTPIIYAHVKIKILNTNETGNITFNTTVSQWDQQNFYYSTPNSSTTAMYSPVTVGPGIDDPLPVELTSFKGIVNSNSVELKWRTETEVNNYGFEIEKAVSPKTNEWENIGFVSGHGNSNSVNNYIFIDKNLTGGNSFSYRLKQLDNDGSFEYSEKIEVEFTPAEFALEQNYPNPFNPSTNINFSLPNISFIELAVYNLLGQKVITLIDQQMQAGNHSIKFEGSSLGSGNYFYVLKTGDQILTKKMQILK